MVSRLYCKIEILNKQKMGNTQDAQALNFTKAEHRVGFDDIRNLTYMIEKLNDDQFNNFMQAGEDNGLWDLEDYKDKAALLESLELIT